MPGVWSRAAFSIVRQATFSQPSNAGRCSCKLLVESACTAYSRNFTSLTQVCCASPSKKNSPACWKCGISVDLNKVLFCKSCEVVQKPDQNADYFQILLQKRTFEIDSANLTRKFRLLQMQLHPDKFSQRTEVTLLLSIFKILLHLVM